MAPRLESEVTERDDASIWRRVEAAAVILVLGFFLYATRDLLNPLLLFGLLWAVLLPFRGSPGHVALIAVTAVVTGFWLLADAGSVLAPFILAVVLAYMLDPLVDRLQSFKVSRVLALGVLTVSAIGLLAAALFLAVPAASEQLGEVVEDVPVLIQRVADWVGRAQESGLGASIPIVGELLSRLQAIDADAVVAFFQERQEALVSWVWSGLLGFGRGVGSFFTILSYVALTPILTFYLLRDWDTLMRAVGDMIPNDRRETVVRFGRECDEMISRYLRGQVTVAVLLGAITWAGLWLVDFPYAGTLALIVAVFNVVPYLGLVLSLIPAIFIALVSGSVGISLLKLVGVYGIAQVLDGSVISPRIVGDSVGLHPVTVVLVLSLGGYFFGFVGLLIGVPGAAVGKLLVMRGMDRYKASAYYQGKAVPSAE
jgi:predicted PurR-regulated permease PerM